jgi:hypothetical protein
MLMPGDWVEVRSGAEVAATLGADGCLEGMPFMPEMAAHCGRRYQVLLRAERTCTFPHGHRSLAGAVVLRSLRCDGALHGGCQLGCMIYWKEAWLRPVVGPVHAVDAAAPVATPVPSPAFASRRCDDPSRNMCQGTELFRATTPCPPAWDPRQYLRLLRVRTLSPLELVGLFTDVAQRRLRRLLLRFAPAPERVILPPLGLEPGDLVVVKGRDAIRATLDEGGRLGGLTFADTMYAFCGRKMKVTAKVEQIIDERNGKLRRFAPGTVLLEGAVCDRYRGCGRNMPMMWREAWLERAADAGAGGKSPARPPEDAERVPAKAG